jgi:hypothetical protein
MRHLVVLAWAARESVEASAAALGRKILRGFAGRSRA